MFHKLVQKSQPQFRQGDQINKKHFRTYKMNIYLENRLVMQGTVPEKVFLLKF